MFARIAEVSGMTLKVVARDRQAANRPALDQPGVRVQFDLGAFGIAERRDREKARADIAAPLGLHAVLAQRRINLRAIRGGRDLQRDGRAARS